MKLTLHVPRQATVLSWLLVTFLVLFPKGGIRIANIPITWGYVLLALAFVPLLLARLLVLPMGQSVPGLLAAATLVPFQLLVVYTYLQNGIENFGYAVALEIAFLFLPVVFLLVFPSFLRAVSLAKFCRHFCFCILAAALWGIFLFFYHPILGKYIEIPLLTVNLGDYGQLETLKHIDRGGYLKLISTYNNGNVYGVATLILLPLYLKLEPALWKRNTVRIALVLTLSRSVWLGMIVEQMLSVAGHLPHLLGHFPRIRPGRALRQTVTLGATAILVFTGTFFFSNSAANIFLDRSLAGRTGELSSFADPTFLPSRALTAFDEVLYASALSHFGILGFLAIVLIFAAPILFLFFTPEIRHSPVRHAAAKGLILYSVVAAADGATVLIPVMAFYWFAYMTMLYGLPGRQEGVRASAPVAQPRLASA